MRDRKPLNPKKFYRCAGSSQNFLPSHRFPEASRPRKWAKPTGVILEHIIY